MPNTLAHIGIQALITRGILPRVEFEWILVGCLIPDLPWILQRVLFSALPSLDAYDLRLYAIAQASLLVSLLASAAFAALSSAPRRAFIALALGSLLHLLLDALQTKLANGVHLFAPWSWKLWNLGLFWPESLPTYLLTGFGLAVFVHACWRRAGRRAVLRLEPARLAACLVLLLAYLLAPLTLSSGPEAADNHSVRTLREVSRRAGRAVGFDRNSFEADENGAHLITLAREPLAVVGVLPADSTTLSARGHFLDARRVELSEIHDHSGWNRDLASGLGIALILAFWLPAPRGWPGATRG